jgi:ADP-ribosylglycohydrolase
MKKFIEKVKAVVVGHAVGDALGVPVEFATRAQLDNAPVLTMQGYGTHHVPKGCWSDDTSMSLATIDSLANGINYDDMMKKFCKWLNNAQYTATQLTFDVGGTTYKALQRYQVGKLPALSCGLDGNRDNGNGSLMRIHPIVLYLANNEMPLEEKLQVVNNVSKLTHAHQISEIACGTYAFLLWELLKNPTKDAVSVAMQKARNFYGNCKHGDSFARLWLNVGRGYNFDAEGLLYPQLQKSQIKSTGYVVDTFEAALWCLLHTNSFRDCVLTAVNLGDDTDTVAAIAGGLAGALYGYDDIPQTWKDTLIKRKYIEDLCEKTYLN